MKKISIKPSQGRQLLYSSTATMVSLSDGEKDNIITITYIAPVATMPVQAMISVNKSRYSFDMLMKSKEYVINLPTAELAFETQYCGRRSGRDHDKFGEMKLTKVPGTVVNAPMIEECWANIECKVLQTIDVGSHVLFIAEIVAAQVAEEYFDPNKNNVLFGEGHAKILQFLGGRQYGTLESSFEIPLDRE